MFIKYSGSDFPILISKINDLISTKSDDYSTANVFDVFPMKDLLLNLKIVVNLYQSDDLKILDNSNLAFHERLSQDLDNTIQNKIVAFFNSDDIASTGDDTIQALNLMFFADFYEYTLFHSNPIRMHDFNSFVRTVIQNFQFFTNDNFICLTRLLSIIPSLGFKKIIASDDFKKIEILNDKETIISKSLEETKQLELDVNKLKERLENYRHEFNFVGLSKGFTNIRDKKDKELLRQNIFYYFIMCAILGFSGAKLYWFSNNYQTLQLTSLIGLSIASIIVLFVLLYFFRISLFNIRALKSQLLQIDLRLSLCEFISNYTEETAKMRGNAKESFDKFENVIFAPIVATDDKIPTTFEGIEQLTGLIGLFNKKTP